MGVQCFPDRWQTFRCSSSSFECPSFIHNCRKGCLNESPNNTWGYCIGNKGWNNEESWWDLGEDDCKNSTGTWVEGDGHHYRSAWKWGAGLGVLYLIVVPIVVIYITTRPVEKLHALQFKAVYGFMYKGLRPGKMYWPVVLVLREVGVSLILVYVRESFWPVS